MVEVKAALQAENVRDLIRLYYDVQKLRIAAENRAKVKEYLLCSNRHLIPMPKDAREPYSCPICRAPAEKVVREKPKILEETAKGLERLEKAIYAKLYEYVKEDPLWKYYLSGVRGIGAVLAAYLIGEAHPSRFDSVSALWKYFGLHVKHVCPNCGYEQDPQGICPKCKVPLVGVAPKRRAGKKTEFNPFARTMAWRLATSFIRQGGVYRAIYEMFAEAELAKAQREGITRLHAMNRARRKLAKLFLSHYWEAGRRILGLPVPDLRKEHKSMYIPPLVDEGIAKDYYYQNIVVPQGREYEALFKQWLEKLSKGEVKA